MSDDHETPIPSPDPIPRLDLIPQVDIPAPVIVNEQLTIDLVIRQRDDAFKRIDELEAMMDVEGMQEVDRLRETLRLVSQIVGVQEFEALIDVVTAKMSLLSALQHSAVSEGLAEAARIALLSHHREETEKLRAEIERLKAIP